MKKTSPQTGKIYVITFTGTVFLFHKEFPITIKKEIPFDQNGSVYSLKTAQREFEFGYFHTIDIPTKKGTKAIPFTRANNYFMEKAYNVSLNICIKDKK